MWTYKIFNSPKILFYAIIKNQTTGLSICIRYADLADKSEEVAKVFIEDIVNKLNK